MQFIQARHYREATRKPEDIRLEVLHTMQAPEKPGTAEAVAAWFAGDSSPIASAHYCIDNDSEVRCVLDKDIAFGAPGANHDGRHYELAGYAQQTTNEWLDPFSDAMLARTAILVAGNCDTSGNAKTWLSNREVETGKRGITHHLVISQVYKKSTHWDVGYHFPVDYFIDMVRAVDLLPDFQKEAIPMAIMNDCVAALRCPIDGGYQKLQFDGGVFNSHGCGHFHRSYLSLVDPNTGKHPDEGAMRKFKEILPTEEPRTTTGYVLIATTGETYDFAGVPVS